MGNQGQTHVYNPIPRSCNVYMCLCKSVAPMQVYLGVHSPQHGTKYICMAIYAAPYMGL